MKRISVTAIVFIAICVMSCKKEEKAEPAAVEPVMYIPCTDAPFAASIMSPNSDATPSAPLYNVWGIFMAATVESGMNDTSGQFVDNYDGWQEAFFCGADGNGFISPKAVSLNNSGLSRTGNAYFAGGRWRSGSLNHWEVSPDENVPEVSANMMDAYPVFNTTLPLNVSLSAGMAYTILTSKITNADSAYILIHSNGHVAKSNIVSVKAGTSPSPVAKISKEQLANMHNEYFTLGNRVFWGAIMELVIYKDTIETFSNKRFAFVTQRQVVRKITFN